MPSDKLAVRLLAVSIATYLMLAAGMALTKRPWSDEAWFANISINILENGKTGISVLHPRGNAMILGKEIPGIDREYYFWTPTHQALQAGWFAVFGAGVLAMRAHSILWGLVALAAWTVIATRLTGSRLSGAAAALLVATDYAFISAASDGRMDMMAAALWFAALAVYLTLRDTHFRAAIITSQALNAAALLTHPISLVGVAVAALLIVYLDHRRIRFVHIAWAALPYAAAAGIAAWYYLPNLPTARAQFGLSMAKRLGLASSLWRTFLDEFALKLASFYYPPHARGLISRSRVLIPILYGVILVASASNRRFRQNEGNRTLLLFTAACFVVMSLYDTGKLFYYVFHYSTVFAALTGAWLVALWPSRPALAAVALLVSLQLSWAAFAIRRDSYHRSFLPMTSALKSEMAKLPGRGLVVGSAELGFEIGFDDHLRDDALLGYRSGLRPDLIVTEGFAYESHFESFRTTAPDASAYIQNLLATRYRKVHDDGYYKIYARNDY